MAVEGIVESLHSLPLFNAQGNKKLDFHFYTLYNIHNLYYF